MNVATTLLLAVLAQEAPERVAVSAPDEWRLLRSQILDLLAQRSAPSLSLGVARDGDVLWLEAIGWADRSSGRPAEPATQYAVGSMSKSITAAAALTLVEEGNLGRETRVADLLDLVHRPWDPRGYLPAVTVGELLNATAGVPHGWVTRTDPDVPVPGCYPGYPALLAFPPGEVFDYSNNSFGLLQSVIESATRKDFGTALRDLVFGPLGMSHSSARVDSARLESYAVRYTASGESLPYARLFPEGGLGLYSSADDLLRYGSAHLRTLESGGRASGSGSPPSTEDPSESFFADGWWTTPRSHVSNGSIAGANAHLEVLPVDRLVVVVLTNQTGSLADEVAGRIVDFVSTPSAEPDRDSRARYMQIFRTPYEPHAAWTGTWAGTIATPCGAQSVELEVGPEVVIRIGSDEPRSLGNLTLNEKEELRGEISARIDGLTSDDAPEQPVRLMLRMDHGRLSGYASAILDLPGLSASLPAYVELSRAD